MASVHRRLRLDRAGQPAGLAAGRHPDLAGRRLHRWPLGPLVRRGRAGHGVDTGFTLPGGGHRRHHRPRRAPGSPTRRPTRRGARRAGCSTRAPSSTRRPVPPTWCGRPTTAPPRAASQVWGVRLDQTAPASPGAPSPTADRDGGRADDRQPPDGGRPAAAYHLLFSGGNFEDSLVQRAVRRLQRPARPVRQPPRPVPHHVGGRVRPGWRHPVRGRPGRLVAGLRRVECPVHQLHIHPRRRSASRTSPPSTCLPAHRPSSSPEWPPCRGERLLAGRLDRGRPPPRGGRFLRFDGRVTPQPADPPHRGHPRRQGLLAGGLRRRHLRLRRCRVLRLDGRTAPERPGGRPGPHRRWHAATGWWPRTAASSPSAMPVPRLDGWPAAQPAGGRHLGDPVTVATGWWPPTAASSPSAPRSTGRWGGPAQPARSTGWPSTRDGRGYWFVASDGGLFTFGDAALPWFGRRTGAGGARHRHGRPRQRRLLAGRRGRRDLLLRCPVLRGRLTAGVGSGVGSGDRAGAVPCAIPARVSRMSQ